MQSHPHRVVIRDLSVYVWPALLTPAECAQLAQAMPWHAGGGPNHAPEAAAVIRALVEPKLRGAPPVVLLDELTLSSHPLPWHFDAPTPGAAFKLAIYPDAVTQGGTTFDRAAAFTPHTPQGTVVLFDLRLEHRSEGSSRKRVIGLRAAHREVPPCPSISSA